MPKSHVSRTVPEAQAESRWIAPVGTLGSLVASAHERHVADRFALSGSVRKPRARFAESLTAGCVGVIAEIKRVSPSRGQINPALDAGKQAALYESLGAAAISVLTEPTRFGGSLADLVAVGETTRLPILRKDFLVRPEQIAESVSYGASAVLLIVRALPPSLLREMLHEAEASGLDVLTEVRDEAELEVALSAGARIIGVNARNLETLQMDAETHARILPLIPPGCVAVAESGFGSREDVERAAAAGADAVLVGSSLSAAVAGDLLTQLASVPRSSGDRRN